MRKELVELPHLLWSNFDHLRVNILVPLVSLSRKYHLILPYYSSWIFVFFPTWDKFSRNNGF